jgi:hypothetical protein
MVYQMKRCLKMISLRQLRLLMLMSSLSLSLRSISQLSNYHQSSFIMVVGVECYGFNF